MRAIQQAAWGGAETMALVEVAEPEPVFGEVLVLVSGQAAWTPGLRERAAELGVRTVDYLVDPDGAVLDALAGLVADGRLTVHVDAVFPLAEAAAAHDRAEGGHTTGKIVLAVGEHA